MSTSTSPYPAEPAAAGGGSLSPPPALLLHRWRRLDWRFLLPVPDVGRLAVGGRVDDGLRDALPLLAGEVHEVTSVAGWSALPGNCDVVVLVRPTVPELGRAAAALRPGGWLYAEVRRDLRGRGPRSLAGWHRALERLGLDDVAAHWHAPDLATTSRIVSLQDRTAVRHALDDHDRGRLGDLRSGLATVLLGAGLLPLLVPEGSVVGRRRSA
ncbi:hypothetical protein ACI78V_08345 [Geodermatophilus sp. SYSU D00742]